MSSDSGKPGSRRDFLKLAATAAAVGPFFLFPARAKAQKKTLKTLKIAKWAHFVPEHDAWFESVLAKEWGRQHDTEVIVDRIPVEEISARASAEAAARRGHDLFMFPWPPAEYRRQVIDHAEIYQAVSFRHGNVDRLGHKSTFDPQTKKYFAFADSWMPAPLLYFEDYWRAVNMPLGPLHYGSLRSGGQRIRAKLGIPCGLALAPSLESNVTLHTLLHAFGSAVVDAGGDVVLNRGARTVAALQYVKALYQDAGAPEQLSWGPAGNVRAMLGRKTSCTTNAISLLRAAEKENPEIAKKIRLSPPLLGSAGVRAIPHVTNCSAVWSFAENGEGAKQFLSDLIDRSKDVYETSQGCNFPIFQKTVPDLIVRLEKDPRGDPPYKYKELKDALHWTANLGFPGYANPVAMEAFNSFVIPRMFMSAVTGKLSPQDAARSAEAEVKRIAEKWRQAA
ncbi:MAG TPA: twin-arginine translocation signal domain-containing protein [Thermoanaerobaculia bacterium]|nr:twin-arginine translocation signal domain-containing protein [Thermoanaerobaculia bacterium]